MENDMNKENEGKNVQERELYLEEEEDQAQTIRLLQIEVSFQKELIDKQEIVIRELQTKVEDLTLKLKEAEGKSKTTEDSNIWKATENLSLADAVRETAECALLTSQGFVFDPQTQLYCNYSTGYYYDPGQSLYYNGHTGTYYTYNADKQEYYFHSQIDISKTSENKDKKPTKKKVSKKSNTHKAVQSATSQISSSKIKLSNDGVMEEDTIDPGQNRQISSKCDEETDTHAEQFPSIQDEIIIEDDVKSVDSEIEEGEISSDSEQDCSEDSSDVDNHLSDCEMEEKYPPCIRAIILESNTCDIKKGSLFIITCTGGTIGSADEGVLVFPHPDIDKVHACIKYTNDAGSSSSENKYFITDLGSKSGTYLNGTRLSESLEQSIPHEILHGSVLKIGDYSVLLHIHPGTFTCGHCEPGLTMENSTPTATCENLPSNAGKSKNAILRQIKKKYGINQFSNASEQPLVSANYKDRAVQRRLTKGSDNPYEKTQVATMDDSISTTNKGFKLLSKMGWTAGNGIGSAKNQGLLEPIKVEIRTARQGLGTPSSQFGIGGSQPVKAQHKNFSPTKKITKADRLGKTIKRFKESTVPEADVESIKSKNDIKIKEEL